jgi:hypothetical protein
LFAVELEGLGVLVSGIAYAAWAALRGAPINMDYVLVFQRIFGDVGFMAVPMSSGGLHVAVVALFISATVFGVTIQLVGSAPQSSRRGRQGVLLTLVGTWSLLSMPYFASRSYTATLMGGYAFQIGFVLAALLPFIDGGLSRLFIGRRPATDPLMWASVILGLIATSWCLGYLRLVHSPAAYLARAAEQGQVPTRLVHQIEHLNRLGDQVGREQLLDMPALTALLTGIRSEPVVNNPAYLALSRNLATLQCTAGWAAGTKALLISPDTLSGLRRAPACWIALDLGAPTSDSKSPELLQVTVRNGSGE